MCQFWCVFFGMAAFFCPYSFSPWYHTFWRLAAWYRRQRIGLEIYIASKLCWAAKALNLIVMSSINHISHSTTKTHLYRHKHTHTTQFSHISALHFFIVSVSICWFVYSFHSFFPPHAMPFHLHSVILKLESHPCQALKRRLFVTVWQYIIYFWSYHR